MFDIPEAPVRVTNLPAPPEGMEIVNVDMVVRLRPKACAYVAQHLAGRPRSNP